MRVLVACEYSGIVRDAFCKAGHDAWSVDLLPTESDYTKSKKKHIIGDIFEVLKYPSFEPVNCFSISRLTKAVNNIIRPSKFHLRHHMD